MDWLNKALEAAAARVKDIGPEVGAEFNRLGVQGAAEIANVLFTGSGFVPYGAGQHTHAPEPGPAQEAPQMDHQPPEHQQERGGMEM
ncbi:hypothetical protein VT84_06815 [Gemmata sp. SH-PL17]|uniref:hypothetical protein n=1 Tax=Gemmata sp. SH-PL17 TaxID=1630693 RepID=UPI00078B40B2|nr:hypothetical protein [Gemmata sp. SH-PL17]AMV24090.1 hypothetical protein VT84_06815 [Gemmata sp. SH-PL17]